MGRRNSDQGATLLGAIIGVILVFIVMAMISNASTPECIKGDCDNDQAPNSLYCYLHKRYSSSRSGSYSSRLGSSKNSYSSGSSNSSGSTGSYKTDSSNTNRNSSTYKYDPYDVYEYDDPDDFAEEWAEEFGDGSFDDGYDDAYDYWEEERD